MSSLSSENMGQDQGEDEKLQIINTNASPSSRQIDGPHHHQSTPPIAFSIATPAVTTILPMSESLSDASFMLPTTSYQHEDMMVEKSFASNDEEMANQSNHEGALDGPHSDNQSEKEHNTVQADEQTNIKQSDVNIQDDGSKRVKKRNKITKKSAKLDAKSKLEKSRQSARECRARKKLRYQYLEDLVCNREKAVIKLREELSMFCELSKQIDVGTISDVHRRLLAQDQTKENSRCESTSLL